MTKHGQSMQDGSNYNIVYLVSVRRPVMHFSHNNYNLPSSITLLFSILLHVSASTGGRHQDFVHYIKHKCTYISLLCELAIKNLNFILCHFVKIVKSIKLQKPQFHRFQDFNKMTRNKIQICYCELAKQTYICTLVLYMMYKILMTAAGRGRNMQ